MIPAVPCCPQAVHKAKQLQARVDGLAPEAAAAPQLRQQLQDAQQALKAQRAAGAALQKQLADAATAAGTAATAQRQLRRLAEAGEAAAAAAQGDATAAREALQGLTAEVEAQRLGDTVDDLRYICNLSDGAATLSNTL